MCVNGLRAAAGFGGNCRCGATHEIGVGVTWADHVHRNALLNDFHGQRAGETHERMSEEDARARSEELMEKARRDIEAETRRAIQDIRREVADLTVMATEKVTRKVLSEEDQQRLVEEALSEIDFSALASGVTE